MIEGADAGTFSPPDPVSEPLMVVDPAAVIRSRTARTPVTGGDAAPDGAPVVASALPFEETLTQRLEREQPVTPRRRLRSRSPRERGQRQGCGCWCSPWASRRWWWE